LIPHFHGGAITGKVEVDGLDTMKHSTKELATRVGMVFQDPENQLVTVDVEREIAFGLENLGFPKGLMAKRVEEALDTVGIANLRHRTLNGLSGGEKQRVAIASVLALYPDVLVLDEPTSELDPKGAEEVLNVVERLNDELGITVILIEHRLDRVVQHVDRIIVLDNGVIVSDGTPRSTLSNGEFSKRGVEVPPMIRLVQGLRDKGISIDNTPLTVKEGRAALARVFQHRVVSQRSAERGEGAAKNLTLQAELTNDSKSDRAQPLVEVKRLYHVYPGEFVALRNISLKVHEAEFVAIMGRNASGKTTLVKHFNGLLKPTKGDVVVDGVNTKETTTAHLARKVGYVFQNPNDHLFADSVEQEIAFSLRHLGFQRGEMEPMIDEVLKRFGLTQYRHRYPRSLSGGEKQRVALASILVAQPKIIILDEPTRGMEYKLKAELMSYLDSYRKEGRVVILVTQDVETVAEYGDRVILLSEGRIVVDGAKRDLLSQALIFSPQINRLAQSLSHYGVPSNLLTANEVLRMVT